MVKARFLLALLLLLLLVEMNLFDESWIPGVEGIDCVAKCKYRCSKSGRVKMCKRACNTCCERCHCVPSGTSGHKEECPCYAKMKTHHGKPKCP